MDQNANTILSHEMFLRRRQRLSIEQLQVLIEVGDNLLPTLYLPELEQLKEEKERAQTVIDEFEQVLTRRDVTDQHLTELIDLSETLIVDINKSIWQAATHTN